MTTWRQTVLINSESFLGWLNEKGALEQQVHGIAEKLECFLVSRIQSADDAREFWDVIPRVRDSCNDLATFQRRLAVEAYAYVHFLDRYWRTFDVLTELTSKGVLPTASEGVRVLDVGTGPGPAAIAIEDYYSLLTEFGGVSEARNFIGQSAAVSVIEQSEEMLRFLRHFCEFASRPAPNEAPSDFSTLDVVTDRVNYHHRLRSAEWYEPATDDYFPEYSAADANTVAQRLHRYRLIVFSNFFTEEKSVLEFRNVILKLFKDLRNGGTVTVLSASGRQYKSIHETIASLAASSRLKPMREVSSSLGAGSYFRVAGIIKNFQHKVYLHLLSLSGPDSLERGKSWPDYWNPEPYQGRRSEFGLRVYRKGKWPGNTK